MGTNRRSRRRSAARILNSTNKAKRQRIEIFDYLDDNSSDFSPHLDCDTPSEYFSPDLPPHDSTIESHQPPSIIENTHVAPCQSDTSPTVPLGTTNHIDDTSNLQCVTPTFNSAEICSYELMTLLDNAGCPRNTYERVVGLLKKQQKRGFQYSQAYSRDKLLKLLRQKFHCPSIQSSVINNCEVFSFPFIEMLQDLIDSAGNELHRITPADMEDGHIDDELWNSQWMKETFLSPTYANFNPTTDIMLPLILYIDKTGTDVLQRYSLEPMLFTVAAIKREARENRKFWRHLGFVPSSKCLDDSKESLKSYHQRLSSILVGLKHAQQNRPLIQVKNCDGTRSYLHAHVPLMIITGDQLSQDTLCCRRKANAGGAGRIHRSCMCSYLRCDDPLSKCKIVPKALLDDILNICNRTDEDMADIIDKETLIRDKINAKSNNSSTMKYFRRQQKLFTTILNKPFTQHPVVSAFHDIDFGAWSGGVYDATFDDFMHSFEEGMMENIGSTLFGGLVHSETEKLESIMIPLLSNIKSSARNTFPRWRIQKGYSRQTLMTMSERVGSVFSLVIALHHPDVSKIFHDGHERQRTKYQHFPTLEEDSPMYYERHVHQMSVNDCKHTLIHLVRHGFDISAMDSMDDYQINQLIHHAFGVLEKTVYPDSYPEFRKVDSIYCDRGIKVVLDQRLLNRVIACCQSNASDLFKKHRRIPVEGVIPKHYKKKEKLAGDGATCAFLGTKIFSLALFLEYTLCYHAFCKYSSSLPSFMQRDLDLIDFSGRSLVTYFGKMIYRGDGTIDSRTTKVHAQRRLGHNFSMLGNLMHACCEVGERLLKTEAKKISRTAQQRGCTTFEKQTCSRILDRHLMDKMGVALTDHSKMRHNTPETLDPVLQTRKDVFARHHPHFLVQRNGGTVTACDRKGGQCTPNSQSGTLNGYVVEKLLEVQPHVDLVEVYNEVILRDGSYIRAFPNYRGEGPWYDFVNIQWEDLTGIPYLLPAQCLAFYKDNNECMAIIQSVEQDSCGKVPQYNNTVLTTHFKMQCTRTGAPVLYHVTCASINSSIMAVDHRPGTVFASDDSWRRSITIVRPRNEWAYAWYVWNQHLKIKNTNRTLSRPYVDLGTDGMVGKVRKLLSECLQQIGKA